ncbi:MAG TPA: ORF6N domain-containing protein [Bacteroidia bacterium]|nr:ORF6N domain-containing protein [Bacteroidia bacterium]
MTAVSTITEEAIINKIYLVRGYKVMLDKDLAELYGVETKVLNQAVKRNPARFPEDFMFQTTNHELINLRSQFVTSSWGGQRYLPYAFTEHGVLMLSSVLNSQRAIQMNIHIMRVYTKLREVVLTNKDILLKLEQLEGRVSGHDEDMQMIFSALKQLLNPPQAPRKRIGFKNDDVLDELLK